MQTCFEGDSRGKAAEGAARLIPIPKKIRFIDRIQPPLPPCGHPLLHSVWRRGMGSGGASAIHRFLSRMDISRQNSKHHRAVAPGRCMLLAAGSCSPREPQIVFNENDHGSNEALHSRDRTGKAARWKFITILVSPARLLDTADSTDRKPLEADGVHWPRISTVAAGALTPRHYRPPAVGTRQGFC